MSAALGLTAPPLRRVWDRLPEAWQQALFMLLVVAGTYVFTRLGGSMAGRLFFLGAAAVGAYHAARRSPWSLIVLTLWFWSLSAFVRRIIDYNSSFDPVNFVLAAPIVMTLFMVPDILTSRELLRCRESLLGLFPLLTTAWGACVNLVQGDLVPVIAASADWLGPVIYFYYVLAHWRRIGDMARLLPVFLAINGALMAGYGIYQFFDPPVWDVYWAIESQINSIGYPKPYLIRVFGTLNTPGPLAFWVGTLILLMLHFRTRVTGFLLPALVLLLLLTLIRSVLVSTVLGLLLAAFLGRASTFKMLGVIIFAVVLGASTGSALDPDLANLLSRRLTSFGNISDDDSALDRERLYRRAPEALDANPLGIGIGGIGRGAVAGQNSDLVTVDSGLIAMPLTLGWVAGFLYLAGTGWTLVQTVLTARQTRSGAALSLSLAAVGVGLNIPFLPLIGFNGVLMWLCASATLAIGIAFREGGAKVHPPPYTLRLNG